jgi:hypothetical protein
VASGVSDTELERAPESFDAAWRRTLKEGLNNNFLMDCAKGKTAFAWGAVYILNRLAISDDPEAEENRLRKAVAAFMAEYMRS